MPAPRELPASRNPGIDVLRGLSILLVVLHHLGLRIPLRRTLLGDFLPKRLLNALNFNGYEAVFIFFVVSGFLITRSALQRWGRLPALDTRAFYARRFARIMPCLVVLVAVMSVLHLAGVRDYTIERPEQSLAGAIFAALGLHLNWYEGTKGYLPGVWDVLWSLSIEEVFYLGFPLVCLLARRTWVLVLLLTALALSLPFTRAALEGNDIWQEKAYLPGMSAIALGVLGALGVSGWKEPPAAWRRALLALGTAGLLMALLGGDLLWRLLKDGSVLWLSASALAVVMALELRPPRALPGTGWLRSWGRLSYEIYLTHMFVVFAAVRLFRAAGGELRHGYLWYLPALPLCWLLGRAVERGLSGPAERWLRERLLPRRKKEEGEALAA